MTMKEMFRDEFLKGLDTQQLSYWVNFTRYNDLPRDKIARLFRMAVGSCSLIMYNGEVYGFNGEFYEKFPKADFDSVVESVAEDRAVLASYWDRLKMHCWNKVADRSITSREVNHSLLCFTNGVVNFGEMDSNGRFKLMRHSKNHYVFFQLPYDYQPGAKCPLWDKFIGEVLPDVRVRDNLQELCGCIFLDRERYRMEKMAMLFGEGANGKSVFATVITGVLGTDNVSFYDLKDLTVSADREKNLASINGKLLNYCTDADDRAINNPNVKALISREPTHGRQIYSAPEMVRDIPMIFVNVNRLPVLKDANKAYARRIAVYPFNVTIPPDRRDVQLAQKMVPEYSGILNWMIEGLYRLVGNDMRFTDSPEMDKYRKEFEDSAQDGVDIVEKFLNACRYSPIPLSEDDAGFLVPIDDIFLQLQRWAVINSVHGVKGLSRSTVSHRLTARGYLKRRATDQYGEVQPHFRCYGDPITFKIDEK